MNPVGPRICRKCGHTFPPGAPEPSWCPQCGALCSVHDEAAAPKPLAEDETPELREDKARWRPRFCQPVRLRPDRAGHAGTAISLAGCTRTGASSNQFAARQLQPSARGRSVCCFCSALSDSTSGARSAAPSIGRRARCGSRTKTAGGSTAPQHAKLRSSYHFRW